MKAVLLAAGPGTRLGALTDDLPKILQPVAGKPMLERQLRYLERQGVTEVAINAHAHHAQVANFVLGWNARSEMRVLVFAEPTLLGTAQALQPMKDFLTDQRHSFLGGNDPFVVLYGDVLVNAPLRQMVDVLRGASAVIGVAKVEDSEGCGVVQMRGDRVLSFEEKPEGPQPVPLVVGWLPTVNAGVYVLRPELLDKLHGDFGRDVWPRLVKERIVKGFYVDAPIDIGTPEGLAAAQGPAHLERYFNAASDLCGALPVAQIDRVARKIAYLRDLESYEGGSVGGRLFVLGVGGSAANASHAVNDLRKLCGVQAYAPTDNVAELTARTNDDGWDATFLRWLETSRLNVADGVLALSVGGGSREYGISTNLTMALEYAKEQHAWIFGIVGAPGGTVAELADEAVIVDPPASLRTPLVESFQALVWHALVTHPALALEKGKWESVL